MKRNGFLKALFPAFQGFSINDLDSMNILYFKPNGAFEERYDSLYDGLLTKTFIDGKYIVKSSYPMLNGFFLGRVVI